MDALDLSIILAPIVLYNLSTESSFYFFILKKDAHFTFKTNVLGRGLNIEGKKLIMDRLIKMAKMQRQNVITCMSFAQARKVILMELSIDFQQISLLGEVN